MHSYDKFSNLKLFRTKYLDWKFKSYFMGNGSISTKNEYKQDYFLKFNTNSLVYYVNTLDLIKTQLHFFVFSCEKKLRLFSLMEGCYLSLYISEENFRKRNNAIPSKWFHTNSTVHSSEKKSSKHFHTVLDDIGILNYLNRVKGLIEKVFTWNKNLIGLFNSYMNLNKKKIGDLIETLINIHCLDLETSYCFQGLQCYILKLLETDLHAIEREWYNKFLLFLSPSNKSKQSFIDNSRKLLWKMMKITDKVSLGNRLTLIKDGDSFFDSVLSNIKTAKSRVWIESYIFDNSKIAKIIVNEMIVAKKQRNCDVILIIDWLGSWSISLDVLNDLKKNEVEVVIFNKPKLPFGIFKNYFLLRDHRKIIIIDDVGYCGSSNISENTGGQNTGNSRFFDVHVKMEGPCIQHLEDIFIDSIQTASTKIKRYGMFPKPSSIPFEEGGTSLVYVFYNNRRIGIRQISKAYEISIKNSIYSLFLTSSYFFPPRFLRKALENASSKGTLLSILLSGNSDVWGDMATTNVVLSKLMKKFSRGSARIFRTTKHHCHAKYMTVDGLWALVGSFNFDRLSSFRNLEVAIGVFDPLFVKQLNMIHSNLTIINNRNQLFIDKILVEIRNFKDLATAYLYVNNTNKLSSLPYRFLTVIRENENIACDHLLSRNIESNEVTMDSCISKINLLQYIVYKVILWSGGMSLDQFVGPEKNMIQHYHKLLSYDKTRIKANNIH